MKILIDNGHGVDTPGKRSPRIDFPASSNAVDADRKFREYLYCREVARDVVLMLRRRGYDAELVVPEDADISLRERCNRVNAVCDRVGADKVLLVSIHNNAAGSGADWMSARGWEAWTSVGQTRGDKLADALYEAAANTLLQSNYPAGKIRRDMSDGDADKESNFYILKHTKCAACLTENMFQDNREDVAWLLSDEGRAAIAAIHVEGIENFIGC